MHACMHACMQDAGSSQAGRQAGRQAGMIRYGMVREGMVQHGMVYDVALCNAMHVYTYLAMPLDQSTAHGEQY